MFKYRYLATYSNFNYWTFWACISKALNQIRSPVEFGLAFSVSGQMRAKNLGPRLQLYTEKSF